MKNEKKKKKKKKLIFSFFKTTSSLFELKLLNAIDHLNKWEGHNPESVLEKEMHKLLWDFEIQTDHLISTRRPDLVIINKKKKKKKRELTEFAVSAHH